MKEWLDRWWGVGVWCGCTYPTSLTAWCVVCGVWSGEVRCGAVRRGVVMVMVVMVTVTVMVMVMVTVMVMVMVMVMVKVMVMVGYIYHII
jgi:hypothetical protein